MKSFPKILINSLLLWSSSAGLLIFLIVLSELTKGSRYDKLVNSDNLGPILAGIPLIVGGISFIILFLSSIIYVKNTAWFKTGKKPIRVLKILLMLLTLPLILMVYLIKPLELVKSIRLRKVKEHFDKSFLKNLLLSVLILIFFFPLWGAVYFLAGYVSLAKAGLISVEVPIAGTGSMYPTFPKGQGKDQKELGKQIVGTPGMLPYPNGIRFAGLKILSHEIEMGDIVVVENEKIRSLTKELYNETSGWVKRVIALPQDTLELRDGIVYLNGKSLKEPYVAKSRSTFGQSFLQDCKKITVPKNSLFIMGDNRKGSGDSREIGFVKYEDVQFVLPYKDQLRKLDKGWHDPKDDDKESVRIALDGEKYLELLNTQRIEAGLKPLRYEKRLENSSQLRAENILKLDDFSYEATKSGYTQVKAMDAAGYSNIVWNEGILQGSYEAEELIEYLYEIPGWKKNIFEDKDFQDFGIAQIRGEINGCPTQVVVQHLAGYIPATYKQETIDSWEKVLSNLREIYPSWAKIKEYPLTYYDYRKDADRLLDIFDRRISMIERIVSKMENRQWFDKEETSYLDHEDKALYDESEELIKKLNNIGWQL